MSLSKNKKYQKELLLMKVYQNKKSYVNDSYQLINPELLTAKASEGIFKLSIDLGLEVIRQMMESEVTEYAGMKGKHDKNRKAFRHGEEETSVVVGGAKSKINKPRIRKKDGDGEIVLKTLKAFQNEDPLNNSIIATVLAGVSCRKYNRTLEGMPKELKCVSKSEVARRFAAGMKAAMDEFFGRRIDVGYPALMIDGMVLGKMTIVAAMGIKANGEKQMLGIIEGGSENSAVAKALLNDLLERGLDPTEPRLYTIDGSKALTKAISDTFGDMAVIQRCQVHKKRNVLSQLPESMKAETSKQMTAAYREYDYMDAKPRLDRIAKNLEHRYPAAAASLREGLEETLTVHKLGIPGLLRQTLTSTNAIESANSVCAGVIRRVSYFRSGEVALRQAAAGFMEAERGFYRIKGYREIPILQNALARLTNTIIEDNMTSA
jgi:transposase-like protein